MTERVAAPRTEAGRRLLAALRADVPYFVGGSRDAEIAYVVAIEVEAARTAAKNALQLVEDANRSRAAAQADGGEPLSGRLRRQVSERTVGRSVRDIASEMGLSHSVLWRFLHGHNTTGRNLDLIDEWLTR